MKRMDYAVYKIEVENAARHYALLKDSLLDDTVLDLFEKYGVSEADAGAITACLTIRAAKDTVKRMRGGR